MIARIPDNIPIANDQMPPLSQVPVPEGGFNTKIIPIPVYSTLPNEGSTYGIMPVLMRVHNSTGAVDTILAPSGSYNDVIGYTGTFRWFKYPSPDQNLVVNASFSQRVNWNSLVLWQDLPFAAGRYTNEFEFRTERSIFYRFFGIGPETAAGAESSFTLDRQTVRVRRGLNVNDRFNVGVAVRASHDQVESIGIPGITLATDEFPDAPGMQGSTSVLGETLDLRYDTRPNREYSMNGYYADFQLGGNQGLMNSPGFFQTQFDSRILFQETDAIQGAARVFTSYVGNKDVPFYHQSSLGGSFLMRGFTENRFIDQGSWTLEMEQRLRFLRTHIYGVTANWRVDPFVAIGQVFSDFNAPFSEVQVAEGLGFRAWVEPNITGRVDVGYAREGIKTYVELGYPF